MRQCRYRLGVVSGRQSVRAWSAAVPRGSHDKTTNMLVDQHNANVFPLGRKSLKCLLDGGGICLGVDDEKVLLRVWGGCDVLPSGISQD